MRAIEAASRPGPRPAGSAIPKDAAGPENAPHWLAHEGAADQEAPADPDACALQQQARAERQQLCPELPLDQRDSSGAACAEARHSTSHQETAKRAMALPSAAAGIGSDVTTTAQRSGRPREGDPRR